MLRYKDTWMAREENAYNTPNGGHSRSERKGLVRWPDGKLRMVRLGVPDTYFTIPAHGRLAGKYVSGWVTLDVDADELEFIIPSQTLNPRRDLRMVAQGWLSRARRLKKFPGKGTIHEQSQGSYACRDYAAIEGKSLFLVTCRCGAMKTRGDACAVCGKGLRKTDYIGVKNRKPICVASHGFHAVRLTSSAIALGRRA